MSLYETIKEQQLSARKSKHTLSINCLTTLLGEIQTSVTGGSSAAQFGILNPTDNQVLKVVNKFIKNTKETLKLTPDSSVALFEQNLLETYLPKQLDEDTLKNIIYIVCSDNVVDKSNPPKGLIGIVMKHLSANYENQYDSKVVKDLVLSFH